MSDPNFQALVTVPMQLTVGGKLPPKAGMEKLMTKFFTKETAALTLSVTVTSIGRVGRRRLLATDNPAPTTATALDASAVSALSFVPARGAAAAASEGAGRGRSLAEDLAKVSLQIVTAGSGAVDKAVSTAEKMSEGDGGEELKRFKSMAAQVRAE